MDIQRDDKIIFTSPRKFNGTDTSGVVLLVLESLDFARIAPMVAPYVSSSPGFYEEEKENNISQISLTDTLFEDGKKWQKALEGVLDVVDTLPALKIDLATLKINPYYRINKDNTHDLVYRLIAQADEGFEKHCRSMFQLMTMFPSRSSFATGNYISSYLTVNLGDIPRADIEHEPWFKGLDSLERIFGKVTDLSSYQIETLKPLSYFYGEITK